MAADSVKHVVNALFTAKKNADGNGLRWVFADSAILQTIAKTKHGRIEVKNESINDFGDFISNQKPGMQMSK